MDEGYQNQGLSLPSIILIVMVALLLIGGIVLWVVQQGQNEALQESLDNLNQKIEQMEAQSAMDKDVMPEDTTSTMEANDAGMVQSTESIISKIQEVHSDWRQKVEEAGNTVPTDVNFTPPEGFVHLAGMSLNSCRPGEEGLCAIGAGIFGPPDWNKPGEQTYYISLVGGEPIFFGPFVGPLQDYVRDARYIRELYTYQLDPKSL